jgi:cytochrome c
MRTTAALLFVAMTAGATNSVWAQMPDTGPSTQPDGQTLFQRQCGTCHSAKAGEGARQGLNLAGVVGRKPGTSPGFHYSSGFGKVDFLWDEAHLDEWLTKPQDVIPGSTMVYRQNNPAIRKTIIAWLQEQH